MRRSIIALMAAFSCLAFLCLSLPALADNSVLEKDLTEGGAPWALTNLAAERATVYVQSLGMGHAVAKVGVVYSGQNNEAARETTVDAWGSKANSVELWKNGYKVTAITVRCLTGRIHVKVSYIPSDN